MTRFDHPELNVLRAYMLGRLPGEACEEVAAHLDSCLDCEQTVAALDGVTDTLVSRVAESAVLVGDMNEVDDSRMREALRSVLNLDQPTPSRLEDELQGRLGAYQLLEKVGEGGMGVVYKAEHTRLEKIVAIKVLPCNQTASRQAVARFEREMKAVGKLEHPHLVRAHDAGEVDGTHFLVMEFLAGENLSSLVKRLGPLPVADACELIRQAAEGLQCAHEHGLVHRDIKPSNIMLTPSGTVKVLDLGLALLAGAGDLTDPSSHQGAELTSVGQLMGTVSYMAPEQAASSHAVDIRADIYSLGATLYKLLTGHAPMSGRQNDGPANQLDSLATEKPIALCRRRTDVPQELSALVDRLLAKNANDRPGEPRDVADALVPFTAEADPAALLTGQKTQGAHVRFGRSSRAGLSAKSSGRPEQGADAGAPESTLPPWYRRRMFLGFAFAPLAIMSLATFLIVRDRAGNEKARIELKAGDKLEMVEVPGGPGQPDGKGKKSSVKGTRLAPKAPSPFDRLNRDTIDPYELSIAGNGEAKNAPAELVAIIGESRLRHADQVWPIAFSPDGASIAAGGLTNDPWIRIWDTKTGRLIRAIRNRVEDGRLAIPPDGKTLVVSHWDREPRSLLLATGEAVTPPVTVKGVLHFGKHFKVAASVERGGKIRIFEFGKEQPVAELSGVEKGRPAFTPDEKSLAFIQNDRIHLYDIAQKKVSEFAEVGNDTQIVAISPDGRLLAAAIGLEIKVWDFATRKLNRSFQRTGYSYDIAFSRDSRYLAACGQHPGVTMWDLESGEAHRDFGDHVHSTDHVLFSPDGKTIATSGWGDGRVRLWNLAGKELLKPVGPESIIHDLRVCSDRATIVALSEDRKLNFIRIVDGKTQVADAANNSFPLASSANGRYLAQRMDDNVTVKLFDGARGTLVRTFTAPFNVSALALSDDGEYLAAGREKIVVWNLKTGEGKTIEAAARALAFAPDGKRLLISSNEKLQAWDFAAAKLASEHEIKVELLKIQFLPDGQRFVALVGPHYNPTVRLYLATTGEMLAEFGSATSIAVSPDGVRFATAQASLVRIHDAATGFLKHEIDTGIGQVISAIDFAPDGRHLVVAHYNGTIFILRLKGEPRSIDD